MILKPKERVQEHKLLVEFRGEDAKIVDEYGISLTYMFIDGTIPPAPQPGERWEITIRKVSSL